MIDETAFETQFRNVPEIVKKAIDPYLDVGSSTFLDFGCDLGIKTAGYARLFDAERVTGVDINDRFSDVSGLLEEFGGFQVPDNLHFRQISPGESLQALGPVDCVLSWSVFEHVREDLLPGILGDIHAVIRNGGLFFVQINPLYHSRFGAHLWKALPKPWDHLSEGASVETRLREHETLTEDEKKRALSLHGSLNRLRFADFERCFGEAGFSVEQCNVARSREEPPAELLERYDADDLLIEGFQMVLRKQR